jgi:RHS repeat-associated protein
MMEGTGQTTANVMPAANPTISQVNNRITASGYSYDTAGNMTGAPGDGYTFDAENRMISFDAGTEHASVYTYDGEGHRVRKVVGIGSTAITTTFVYDAMGKLVSEYETKTAASETGARYYTQDHLGSTRALTTLDTATNKVVVKARSDYLPFGEEIKIGVGGRTQAQGYLSGSVVVDQNRRKFTGKERDNESELDFFGARFYSSTHGRFTSADDFLNDTHVTDPASWNLYLYVRNNPLKYIDPFGEEVIDAGLKQDDKEKLIADWKEKTGYKDIQFIDGKLVINVKAGYIGGSEAYRTQLLDASTTKESRFELSSVSSDKVAFAHTDEGHTTIDANGKRTSAAVVYKLQIDFGDFKQLSGDKEAIEAFSVGIVTLHEIDHKLYGELTDKPNTDTDPGPVENMYINPGRRQLNLAERINYTAKEVFPKGTRQARFNFQGKVKILRWQHSKVGGTTAD